MVQKIAKDLEFSKYKLFSKKKKGKKWQIGEFKLSYFCSSKRTYFFTSCLKYKSFHTGCM